MIKNLVFLTIILSISRTVLSDADLNSQNLGLDDINPLYDAHQEELLKDQDKRTIFSPSYSNYGLAKHTKIIGGRKVVLGYSPVDLKFVPVIKPVHHGYHYPRPKIHFKHPLVIKPTINLQGGGWKPIARPITSHVHHKPIIHTPGIAIKPTEEVHHVHHVKPVAVPVHVHQPLPVRPAVPFHPVPAVSVVPTHIDAHVHGTHLHDAHLHATHLHGHVDHVHVATPAVASAPLLPAFRPSPLFEVTKPNLGVLPLGATFQSPVLQEPHLHVKPAVIPAPLAPHPVVFPQPIAVPQPVVPQHLVPQPVIPQPVVPQPVLPQPFVPQPAIPHHAVPTGTSIEFHGTYHPVPIHGHVPAQLLPTVPNPVQQFFSPPVNAAHPVLPTHYHNFHSHILPHQHQPQPQEESQIFHPQVHVHPEPTIPQNFFQQQVPDQTSQQFVPNTQQQQLPNNAAPQYFQQTQNQHQSYIINQQQEHDHFDGSHVIQPGQTDLQLPLHLPQHPVLSNQYQQYQDQVSQQTETGFRPSITLEPPYFKRRSSNKEDQEEEEDYDDEEEQERKLK